MAHVDNGIIMRLFMRFFLSIFIFLAVMAGFGEVILRIVFYDGGQTTSLGPGGKNFIYTVNKPAPTGTPQYRIRSPRIDHPEKQDGKKRVLVFGDSITLGQGVKEWTDLYTTRLLQLLNRGKEQYEMDVHAQCGWEIDTHFSNLKKWAAIVHPDIIIYQWYANDMELDKTNAPYFRQMPWQKLPFHSFLKKHSYFWYFLDDRLGRIFPNGMVSYPQYLLTEYAPGTYPWMLFEIYLNAFAHEADKLADQVILMLYPALPYGGLHDRPYVLKPLHDNVILAFSSDMVNFPATALSHTTGAVIKDGGATSGRVIEARQGRDLPGELTYGPYLGLDTGKYIATFVERFEGGGAKKLLTNFVSANNGKDILGRKDVDSRKAHPGWQRISIPFRVNEKTSRHIEFHSKYRGHGTVAISKIVLRTPPLRHPVGILDLYPVLKNRKTWASIFDAHPNRETHAIMARKLYDIITHHNS